MIAFISSGAGDVDADLELPLLALVGVPVLVAAAASAQAPNDVLGDQSALLRVGEDRAEHSHDLSHHGG
jgi:hypothetical protein